MILAAVICMLAATAGPALAGDSPDFLYAARKTVDVYAMPADTAEIVTTVPLGSMLMELDESPTGWVQVRAMDGTTGWAEAVEVSDDVPTRVHAHRSTVIVRYCPTLECPEVERAGFDTELMQVDEDDDWVQVVMPNGVVGWVEEDFVDEDPPKRYLVMVPSANIRSCHSEECPLITTVAHGTTLIRMDKKDDWYHVCTTDGVSGWVYEELVIREDKAHQIPAMTAPAAAPAPVQ
jgi:SH3-like domain-containing protein